MTEATFPLLGTAFVVLIILPACALLSKVVLVLLERDALGGPLKGLNARYVLMTGSSLLPLAWFLSAGLHQAETGKSALACLLDHDGASLCFEPGLFALALATAVLAPAFGIVREYRDAQASRSPAAQRLAARLARLVESYPAIADLRGRIRATDAPDFALGTQGLLSSHILVGTTFAARISDGMLASALGHEREHLRALDPLRYLLLRLALGVNPFGQSLLQPHAARWHAAHEAHCDREAVIAGAAPLPLAEAIVRAARPGPRETVALGARDAQVLRFRVGMLLAFAEQTPVPRRRQGPSAFPVTLVLVLVALLLPHQTGTAALDALHTGAEHTLGRLWR